MSISVGSQRKQENSRKKKSTSISLATSHWIHTLYCCVDHNKLLKMLKYIGTPDHLTCLQRNQYAGKEATVKIEHGAIEWLKSIKEYNSIVYVNYTAYLNYMQSTSCEMPHWMSHKLELILPVNYQQLHICWWYHSNGRKIRMTEEELKSCLVRVREETEKSGWKQLSKNWGYGI